MVGTRRSGRIAAAEAAKATATDVQDDVQVAVPEKRAAVKRRTPKTTPVNASQKKNSGSATTSKTTKKGNHQNLKKKKKKKKKVEMEEEEEEEKEEPVEKKSKEDCGDTVAEEGAAMEEMEETPRRPRRSASRQQKKYAESADSGDDSDSDAGMDKAKPDSDSDDDSDVMEVDDEEEEKRVEKKKRQPRRPASAASNNSRKRNGNESGGARVKKAPMQRPAPSTSPFQHTPARPHSNASSASGPAEIVAVQRPRPPTKMERRVQAYKNIAIQLAKGRYSEMTGEESESVTATLKQQYNRNRHKAPVPGQLEQKADPEVNSSSSEDEWEEMETAGGDEEEENKDDKKITVTVSRRPAAGNKKDPWAAYLRQEVNRAFKANMENAHKCHLLCYMAHLQRAVRAATEENLIPSLILTLMPAGYASAAGQPLSEELVGKMVKWFASAFKVASGGVVVSREEAREHRFRETARLALLAQNKEYETDLDRAMLLLACMRGLEAPARLVCSCRVMGRRWDEITPRRTLNGVDIVVVEKKEEAEDKPGTSKGKGEEKKKEKKKKGDRKEERNYWCEYWCDAQERWICVDPLLAAVDRPLDVEARATSPMSYVLAVDHKGGVRDVSSRYAAGYLTPDYRRMRTEVEWMRETLGKKSLRADGRRARQEDVSLHDEMLARPIPTTLSEYKNHPLYALEKDCLKFEAIYPRDRGVLGEVRKHKVYPRSAVHTLQSANNWIKQARSVKEGEEPYKVVKARPDFRVPADQRVQKYLDLFGFWQTEPFRPPKCENGRIPMNEFGNVYMYRPEMCPIGGVHLRLPQLHVVARNLRKPFAAAVVGWDFHGMSNHPVLEGGIVLAEDEAAFRKAWQEMERARVEKEEQKRQARVNDAWRRLIRGVLRHHYVKSKFAVVGEKKDKKKKASKKGKSREDLDGAMETLEGAGPEWTEQEEKEEGEGQKMNWPENRYTVGNLQEEGDQ